MEFGSVRHLKCGETLIDDTYNYKVRIAHRDVAPRVDKIEPANQRLMIYLLCALDASRRELVLGYQTPVIPSHGKHSVEGDQS